MSIDNKFDVNSIYYMTDAELNLSKAAWQSEYDKLAKELDKAAFNIYSIMDEQRYRSEIEEKGKTNYEPHSH